MIRILIASFFGLFSGLALCDSARPINLGIDFQKYQSEVKKRNLDASEIETHVALFKKYVIKDQAQFYLDVVFDKRELHEKFDDLLKKALIESNPIFEKHKRQIDANIKNFERDATAQIGKLQKLIPDFEADIPIYGMVSLNKFGGGVRLHQGKTVLAISMDKIADMDRDFEMIFTHEVFHVYHNQVNPTMRQDLAKSKGLLVAGMFIEGIATYAEGHLNPEKEKRRMVKSLMDWCDQGKYKDFVKEFLADNGKVTYANFDKTKHLYRKWFYTSRDQTYPFPTEAAYCLGDRVVARLAQKHSLHELVRWTVPEFVKQSEQVLKTLL